MQIKILQINIWVGGKLWDNLIEFIKKENPDIIMAQEVNNGGGPAAPVQWRTINAFSQALNYPHHFFAPEVLDITEDKQNVEHGNTIFSKFPLTNQTKTFIYGAYRTWSDEDEKEPGKVPRNIQHATAVINDRTLELFNFHGIVDFRGNYDSPERLAMSEAIIKGIAGKENIILTGDTNVQAETETIRNIEKHLTNVFKGELKTSFNMRQKTNPGYATAVVDMVFASPNIKVREHYCPDVDVSDHFPLVVIIEL